jgi:hypothetical protein
MPVALSACPSTHMAGANDKNQIPDDQMGAERSKKGEQEENK